MCVFESNTEGRYNICIVVGQNETFWKKFASMINIILSISGRNCKMGSFSKSLLRLIILGPIVVPLWTYFSPIVDPFEPAVAPGEG